MILFLGKKYWTGFNFFGVLGNVCIKSERGNGEEGSEKEGARVVVQGNRAEGKGG